MRTRPRIVNFGVHSGKGRKVLTAVVCCNDADDGWPDVGEDKADPALVVVVHASRDCKDVVAALLVDDVGGHCDERSDDTEDDVHESVTPSLTPARDKGCTVCVQNNGQAAEDTKESPRDTDIAGHHDFDFDITQAGAVPPRIHVIIGPAEGIDDVEQIEDD